MTEIPVLETLVARAAATPSGYHEFLRTPAMSAGIYRLPAGAVDRQRPHHEEEIYHVLRGRGRFQDGEADRPVEAGDTLFVPAERPHHFHRIEEELVLLVFFAPPESG